MTTSQASHERGQVLVIVAAGMIALIAMVGLVIDGGHAWGRQRETQNVADSIAKAGNVPILEFLGGDNTRTTGDVGCAIDTAEEVTGLTVEAAEFTDFRGNGLGISVPDCGTSGVIDDAIQGVKVTTTQDFDTFLMQIVGFDELTARADATAVVGAIPGFGLVLPVTFPQTLEVCDDSEPIYSIRDWNDPNVEGGPPDTPNQWDPYEILPPTLELNDTTLTDDNLATIPLCGTAPGSVGWLDYGCGNTHESISGPCDVFLNIPDWILTQTGTIDCCEGDLEEYHGVIPGTYEEDQDTLVKLPIHQKTCEDDAGTTGIGLDRELNPCTSGPGEGNNLWYGVEFWIGFILDDAHVQGSDIECEQDPGTPRLDNPGGGVSCLKGWLVQKIGHPDDIAIGDVDPGVNEQLGITLIN